jgi:hypothetical protein
VDEEEEDHDDGHAPAQAPQQGYPAYLSASLFTPFHLVSCAPLLSCGKCVVFFLPEMMMMVIIIMIMMVMMILYAGSCG